MAHKKPTRRRSPRTNAAGRELLAAVKQMRDAAVSGNLTGFRIREVEIPDPAGYRPQDVRAVRGRLGVTQRLFARLLGVSPELIEHWEQGVRHPSPLARRLLDRIVADPDAYLAALLRRKKLNTTR